MGEDRCSAAHGFRTSKSSCCGEAMDGARSAFSTIPTTWAPGAAARLRNASSEELKAYATRSESAEKARSIAIPSNRRHGRRSSSCLLMMEESARIDPFIAISTATTARKRCAPRSAKTDQIERGARRRLAAAAHAETNAQPLSFALPEGQRVFRTSEGAQSAVYRTEFRNHSGKRSSAPPLRKLGADTVRSQIADLKRFEESGWRNSPREGKDGVEPSST